MKAYVQNNLAYLNSTINTLYYMTGTPPTTPAELNAKVDLSSMSDLHAKCVGVSAILTNAAVDNTGASTYNQTSTLYGAQYSWLKGGGIPVTSTGAQMYALLPSRVFNADTNIQNDYWHMPTNVFAMPIEAISNTYQANVYVKFRDDVTATYAGKAGAGASWQFEYDVATTVSALRVSQGASVSGNMYNYYAEVRYWDGAAWQIAFNAATPATPEKAATTITFTAVTSTKFKVTLYPNTVLATYHSIALCGLMLMHTSKPADISVPDITWGIIVPRANNLTNYLSVWSADATYSYNIDTSANPLIQYSIYAPYFGRLTKFMPAIIDTCGQDSLVNKMAISKSVGLMSNDQPTLASYKYYAGDLL